MLTMMILIMMMKILVMVMVYLPSHASKVMWNPLPDKVADLIESSISIILMMMKIYHIILCYYGHGPGRIKHKQHSLIYC